MTKWEQRRFQSNREVSDESGAPRQPKLRWIAATDSSWGVPLLDVRPITQEMISTTRNQQYAINAVSYKGVEGADFARQAPSPADSSPAALRYSIDQGLFDGILFAPREMEHKWAMY